jgi:HAMP domain-containing protein
MYNRQRSIKNMFVQPQFQMKLSLYYVAVGGIALTIVAALVLAQLEEVNRLMNSGESLNLRSQTLVNELMMGSLQYVFVGFGLFVLFSFGFALLTSHRISGPQVAIKAVIDDIKAGRYDSERELRPNDELQEVMQAVKELAVVLKTRDPG